MDDCIFCKIIDKKIPAHVIYEDAHAVAFLDIMPRTPGHTMVIPKYHAATFLDLPDADVAPLFAAVKKVDALLAKKLMPDGMTIGINQGPASGQEVAHLHVHLMPRWLNDHGSAVQSLVNHEGEESVEEIKRKLLSS